jgi:uncharacterized protein YpmB
MMTMGLMRKTITLYYIIILYIYVIIIIVISTYYYYFVCSEIRTYTANTHGQCWAVTTLVVSPGLSWTGMVLIEAS